MRHQAVRAKHPSLQADCPGSQFALVRRGAHLLLDVRAGEPNVFTRTGRHKELELVRGGELDVVGQRGVDLHQRRRDRRQKRCLAGQARSLLLDGGHGAERRVEIPVAKHRYDVGREEGSQALLQRADVGGLQPLRNSTPSP